MRRYATWFVSVAILVLALGTGQARAQLTFELTVPKPGLSGFAGTYAEVVLDPISSPGNVVVKVSAESPPGIQTSPSPTVTGVWFNLPGSGGPYTQYR